MTSTVYVEPHATIRGIVTATFPEYRGRKFRISISDSPLNVRSSWDGGSRSFYCFVNLATWRLAAKCQHKACLTGPSKGLMP